MKARWGDWNRTDDTQVAFMRLAAAWGKIREPAAMDGFVRTLLGQPPHDHLAAGFGDLVHLLVGPGALRHVPYRHQAAAF